MLLADDSEDALALVQIALQNDKLKFRANKNGEEAIASCAERLPDLAILDILMPGKNGLEVCEWIKQNCGQTFVPVILLTCQSELSDKLIGLNCGADDYITKPFSLPELEARVRSLLRIKELTDQLQQTRNLLAEKEKQLVAIHVAGAAAHELGQPLTAMLLNCELLAKVPADTEDFRLTVEAIQSHCRQMREILHQLNEVTEYRTTDYAGNLEILDLKRANGDEPKKLVR